MSSSSKNKPKTFRLFIENPAGVVEYIIGVMPTEEGPVVTSLAARVASGKAVNLSRDTFQQAVSSCLRLPPSRRSGGRSHASLAPYAEASLQATHSTRTGAPADRGGRRGPSMQRTKAVSPTGRQIRRADKGEIRHDDPKRSSG